MNELRLRLRHITATQTIITLCVIFYVLAILLGGMVGYSESILILGAMEPGFILNGEVWRLLTAAFLHAESPLHIMLNMYVLWQIGNFVERFYGMRKFLVTFVFAAISAGFFSFSYALLQFITDGSSGIYISVGASGAIFGLLGLVLGTTLKNRRYGIQLPIDSNQLLLVIGVNLLLGFILPNIDNAGHIGGLAAGMILSLCLEQNLTFSLTPWKNWFINLAFPLALILLVGAFLAQTFSIGLAAL